MLEKRQKFLTNVAYFAVILAIAYMVFKYLLGLIMPFLLALLFASATRPLVRIFTDKLKLGAGLSGIIATVLFYGIIGVIAVLLGFKLTELIIGIFDKLPLFYGETLEPWLQSVVAWMSKQGNRFGLSMPDSLEEALPQVIQSLGDAVTTLSGSVVTGLSGFIAGMPMFFLKAIIMLIATFFMAADYDRMMSFITNNLPGRGGELLRKTGEAFRKIVLHYGKSYAQIMLITFVLLCIGLLILRADKAVLLALIIAVMDILPVIGTGIALCPWAVFHLVQGNYYMGIGLLALYAVVTFSRQFMEPRIIGKHVGMPPLVALISMFVGVSLFGGVGLFGVPVTVAIIITLYHEGVIGIKGGNDSPKPIKNEAAD